MHNGLINMNYAIYIFFGLAPSVIWLLFFLRKDSHPESNAMILKIFFYGMLAAIPVALIELGFAEVVPIQIIYIFLGIALTEEVFKYLVVRKKVLRNPEFDEPVDAMLYMIVAALGFAALENLLIIFPLSQSSQLLETFLLSSFRFVSATFLHVLCSGLIGYFLALSILKTKKRFQLRALGITIAVFLHGLYNFSIISMEGSLKYIIPIIILISLAIFVSLGFKKVKKLKSICKIREI